MAAVSSPDKTVKSMEFDAKSSICPIPIKNGKSASAKETVVLKKAALPSALSHFTKPIVKGVLRKGPSFKPFTHNRTFQMTERLVALFTRISSGKPTKVDLAKRELYKPEKLIAKDGCDGIVFQGKDSHGNPVILKYCLPSRTPPKIIKEEGKDSKPEKSLARFDVKKFEEDPRYQSSARTTQIFKQAQQSKHTVRLLDSFESSPYEICQVMELMPLNLYNYAKTGISLAKMPYLAKQLLQALIDYKKLGIIHRDLKPENIGFAPSSCQIKVLDFGASCTKDDFASISESGTFEYSSPERILGKKTNGFTEDVWSLGVLLANIYCYSKVIGRRTAERSNDLIINNDLLRTIASLIGGFPSSLLKEGASVNKYTVLKNGVYNYKNPPSEFVFIGNQNYIDNLIQDRAEDRDEPAADAILFCKFIKRMIAYEKNRSTAEDLLQDQFIQPATSISRDLD